MILTRTLPAGTVSFDFKVSSEQNWDFLEFYLDGRRIARWSGEVGWLTFQFDVTAAEHTLEWRYIKDVVNTSEGLDAGFIDNLQLPTATAVAQLNVTLHALRQSLQLRETATGTDSLVQFANDHYYLHPGLNVWTDIDAYTNCITLSQLALKRGDKAEALAHYEMAAVLYRGHFLENDCYEEWTIQHREHLKTSYLTLLAQQSQLYFESNNYTTALEHSRKILEYDHCSEEAHRQIMRCSYALGRRGLALHQYQVLCDILNRELGVCPMHETTRLYEQIKKGSFR